MSNVIIPLARSTTDGDVKFTAVWRLPSWPVVTEVCKEFGFDMSHTCLDNSSNAAVFERFLRQAPL